VIVDGWRGISRGSDEVVITGEGINEVRSMGHKSLKSVNSSVVEEFLINGLRIRYWEGES
jgi:hypothetical protein